MEDRLLDVAAVAKRLNVSTQTIRRNLKDKNHPLRGVRLGKKCLRVFSSSVEETIRLREIC